MRPGADAAGPPGPGRSIGDGASQAVSPSGREREPDARRVFFALWPGSEVASVLAALALEAAKACGGRAMRRDTLHQTLAFIGSVPGARVRQLEDIAARLAGRSFELALDRIEYRPRQRMLWAGSASVPDALSELVTGLGAGLAAGGFPVEERPFAVHVTLVRNCRREAGPARLARLAWPVREFVLVESRTRPEGADYSVLARWPLA